MVGTKLFKNNFNQNEYLKLADWCNITPYKTIEDMGEYYEVVDITPTQEQMDEVKKLELLSQLDKVNTQIKELDVASMCDNGDNTTDVVINGEVITMTSDELDDHSTSLMLLRADILKKIKELK